MVSIRKAKIEDAEGISNVLNEVFSETYKQIFYQEDINILSSIWHNVRIIQNEIKRDKIKYLVAEEKKIVGFMSYFLHNDIIYIKRLYILRDFQRCGIGTELIKNLEKIETKYCKLNVEVERNNIFGYNFYLKNNFKIVDEKNIKILNINIKSVVMEKVIKR